MEQTLQERLRERLQQLRAERQQVAAQLQALLAQAEQARLMLSAYDGAIGELGRLTEVQAAPAMVAADTFDADDVARLKPAM